MKKIVRFFVVPAILLLLAANAFAQRTTDIEGGKDYPLISRFEGSIIEFYKTTKWGTYKLPVNEDGKFSWKSPLKLEGKVTRIQYSTETDNNPDYVLQNYKAAFKKANFTIRCLAKSFFFCCKNQQRGQKYLCGNLYYRQR